MYSYADAQNQRLRIMEYNVENLFDTLHAEGKADYEFTLKANEDGTHRATGANKSNSPKLLPQ